MQGGYAGTGNLNSNPLLGTLANNGGFTQTMALGAGSPAIEAGTNAGCPATDQRGITRPQGSHCDIGAYEYQDNPPTVSSITRLGASPTSAASVNFTVTFSEPVTGVNIEPLSDFTLTTTGVTGAAITGVSGSGAIYTVTVNTGSGNGTVRLDVVDDDSIQDATNNPLGGVGNGNGNFTGGELYTIAKPASINITIGGNLKGSYSLPINQSMVQYYGSTNGGPLVVKSSNGTNIIASLVQYRRPGTSGGYTGMTEIMGRTDAQISTSYVIPRYDYSDPTRYNSLQVANFDAIDTTVNVTIGGVLKGTYNLPVGQSLNLEYAGLVAGPVLVSSKNGAKIVVSLYELKRPGSTGWWTGQNQMLALPTTQLSDTYAFVRYNTTLLDLLPNVVIGVP